MSKKANKNEHARAIPSAMNFEIISIELLRALRGSFTVTRFNQRLGYKYNQVARWEAGSKKIHWKDLESICKINKIPLKKILIQNNFYDIESTRGSACLQNLQGTLSIQDFAYLLGRSRVQVSRWLSGSAEIPMSEIFRATHLVRSNAGKLINSLAPLPSCPTAYAAFSPELAEGDMAMNYPWGPALINFLDCEQCPTIDEVPHFLSVHMGLKESRIHDILQLMLKMDIIEIGADHKYKPKNQWIFPNMNAEKAHQQKRYWLHLADKSMTQLPHEKFGPDQKNLSGFWTLSLSDDGWKKLTTLYFDFFENVIRLMNEDQQPHTQVKSLNLHILDLAEMGSKIDISEN